MSKKPSFIERWQASSEYINAIHELPPTYNTGEDLGFNQYFHDPISDNELRRKLDNVNNAEKKLNEINSKMKD